MKNIIFTGSLHFSAKTDLTRTFTCTFTGHLKMIIIAYYKQIA